MARWTKNKNKVATIIVDSEITTTIPLKRKHDAHDRCKPDQLILEPEHSSHQHYSSRGQSYQGGGYSWFIPKALNISSWSEFLNHLDRLVHEHHPRASLDDSQCKKLQTHLIEASQNQTKLAKAQHMTIDLENQLCQANKHKDMVAQL